MSIGELHIVGNTAGRVVDYQWRKGVLDERVAADPHVAERVRRDGITIDP
jgi:hypothetical protein